MEVAMSNATAKETKKVVVNEAKVFKANQTSVPPIRDQSN
jgi:hypothetical protein